MNILLIQLRRLGDVILTTPAINALRAKFPEAHISLAVTNECRALLPAIAHVDRFFIFRRGLADVGELGRILRQRFDVSIDFTGNDRSALITLAARAPRRLAGGRRKLRRAFRARFYNELVDNAVRESHTVDANLALVAPLGITSAPVAPSLSVPATAHAAAQKIIRENDLGNGFVVIHPGTAREEKFWIAERWMEVIKFVHQTTSFRCAVTGSNSPTERRHIDAICTGAGAVNLAGQLDLPTLAALISSTRLVVTVDSAPVHLASAMGTPQVALFGPTNPFHWRPRTSVAAILTADSPVPIEQFSPTTARTAMNGISTQQVIDAIDAVLPRPAVSPR